MGTNQFLLLILISIITGVALVGGIKMSRDASEQSLKDELMQAIQPAVLAAQAHYKKPVTMGGGGGSYDGFEMPSIRTVNDIHVKRIKISHPTDHLHFLAYVRNGVADDSGIDGVEDVPGDAARMEAWVEAGQIQFSENGFSD